MRAGSRRCPQCRSFSVRQKMESKREGSSFQLAVLSHPAPGAQLARATALSLAFREVAFFFFSSIPEGLTWEFDVWPLCPDILGHAPDETRQLLHFRGSLWCPVTFATVYCCNFETAKNKELCQTTQNFKPHQLQLGTSGESCLYLPPSPLLSRS